MEIEPSLIQNSRTEYTWNILQETFQFMVKVKQSVKDSLFYF